MNVQIKSARQAHSLETFRGVSRGFGGARTRDLLFAKVIQLNAILSIAVILLIFIYLGKEALPMFTSAEVQKEASWSNLFLPQEYGTEEAPLPFVWQPVSEEPKYSLAPLFLGSLKVTLIALLVAAPLSIAAAVYTAEFAPGWLRELIKPVIELLAGIPSVVLGFLALIVLATWLQDVFDFDYRLNAINAGLALGLAIVPIIYTVSEDALSSVPRSYREASLALGVTPWQTAWSVVLPAAFPGIFAALVLGFGRAIGETMIVLMASGNAAVFSWNLADSVRTVSATIAAELGEVVFGSPHYHVLFLLGGSLLVLTFGLNFLGEFWSGRIKRRMQGT
ncbi:MAG: phosphate ABC transporter permease subunit PstC [Acidobacteriota bacterium]